MNVAKIAHPGLSGTLFMTFLFFLQALEKRTRTNKTKGARRIVLLALFSVSGQPATRAEAANEGEAHIPWLLAQREGHHRCRSTDRNKWEEFGVGANENSSLCCWQKQHFPNRWMWEFNKQFSESLVHQKSITDRQRHTAGPALDDCDRIFCSPEVFFMLLLWTEGRDAYSRLNGLLSFTIQKWINWSCTRSQHGPLVLKGDKSLKVKSDKQNRMYLCRLKASLHVNRFHRDDHCLLPAGQVGLYARESWWKWDYMHWFDHFFHPQKTNKWEQTSSSG